MNKTFVILAIILLLGALLRFYNLGKFPVGLHRDEAFLGYNAYSILETGKDMNGNFLPLHLKSFLYSPAGYSYLSIPFIKFFGLNAFSVRFPSALFGSLTVLVTYFLVKELFKYSLETRNLKLGISTIAVAMLAVSPWHINLSRTATENTIVVFFIALGSRLYLYSLRKSNKWILLLGFASFFVTTFIYQASRAFLPLFVPLLILAYPFRSKKMLVFSALTFILTILLPLTFILISKDLSLRLRTVSIFATSETQLILDDHILTDGTKRTPLMLTRVFHNKLVGYAQQFLKNYFSHFSYNFLFSDAGFPDRYRVPLVGLLYVAELPLLLFGVFKLLTIYKRLVVFLLGWVIFAPLGSALTFDDAPNLQRSLIIFPALSIIAAFGIRHLVILFKKNSWLKMTGAIFVSVLFYNIFFYLHQYYVHSSVYRPWYRQDGYKELVGKVNSLLTTSKKAIVTDRESAPTIFFLFYSKYSPVEFQKETKNTKIKDFDRISFGPYEFSQEECPLRLEKNSELKKKSNTIFVNSGLCKEISNMGETQIKRQDGSIAFRIYTVDK